MDDRETSSVKATITSFEANPAIKKLQPIYPEVYSKTRELRRAMRDTDHLSECRKLAETATAKAETELAFAKETMKELTLRIEESNARAKVQMEDFEGILKRGGRKIEGESAIVKELELAKREMSKLKLNLASVLEEKRRVEKEWDDSLARVQSYTHALEALNKEIEGTNEEHVLVELARIEAVKEYEQVEAQRREKAREYSVAIKEINKKKQDMLRGITKVEELEKKLAMTTTDACVLGNELRMVKEMNQRIEKKESKFKEEDNESSLESSLHTVEKELEAAKKELAIARDGSFQFMASMDVIRVEHERVRDELARLKINEKKTEATIQSLNAQLLKAKAKLEAAAAAEDKTKPVVSNLLNTFEQLETENETTKKEHAMVLKETAAVNEETEETERAINLAEDRLQIALQDLIAAKSAEAAALENLQELTEKTMRSRVSASAHAKTITISRFEYEYLMGHAAGAKTIADKKVAAAHAWIEALKASEKEIEGKYELMIKETRELEERSNKHEANHGNKQESNNAEENEFEKWRQSMGPEKVKPETVGVMASKGRKRSIKMGAAGRRAKGRTSSASPMVLVQGTPRTTSFTVRRRRKVIGDLTKFFGRKSGERNR